MPKCNVDGETNIYYEFEGSGTECLVFVSGTGFNSETWKPFQVPYFSTKFKVLISDHRGLGFSDKPDSTYTTRMFAEDIVQVMDNLGLENAHVVGHSMGGRVAQWMALDHPNRIKKLVLAATGSGNFSDKPDYVRGIPLETAYEIAEKGFDSYLRSHVESDFFFNPDFARRDPVHYRAAVEAHLTHKPPLRAYLRHVIARQMHETSSRVHEIKSPTLVLVGDSDKMALGTGNHFEASRFLTEIIPKSRMKTVVGARHAFFWERWNESNKIIMGFLEE